MRTIEEEKVAGLLPCPMKAWNTRADSHDWQSIETAPINESVLVYIPNAEHYGDGIYRAIWIESDYEPHPRHWQTTGLHHGCDLNWLNYQPTHWMPLPAPPSPITQDGASVSALYAQLLTERNALVAERDALYAALKLYVDHFGDPLKVARAAIDLVEKGKEK